MNLLFVLPEYVRNAGGGIITFYRHFLPQLARQGHKVRVIVGSGVHAEASASPVIIEGVTVETLRLDLLKKYRDLFSRYSIMPGLRSHLAAAWAMREQAKDGEGADVVEAADWGLLFVPWVIEQGPPCVAQLHGSVGQIDIHDPVRGEELQGHLIRLIERSAVQGARSAQAYSRANALFWQGQSGREVACILPAWRPLLTASHAGRRSQRGLVVGRVQRWKGPEVLCEALRLLGTAGPAVDWIGRDTSYGRRSRTTTAHLASTWPEVWGRQVVHRAQQSAESVSRLQAEAGVVIVPSLWDTFNFTCVEAMGAGTPVICSTGAGASDLIDDGQNGLVFESGRHDRLAIALERFLSLSDADKRVMGEAGRQTVEMALDPVARAQERLEAYDSVIRSGPQKGLPEADWLASACRPAEGGDDSLAFLDHLPLQPLTGYTIRRIGQKLSRRT